DFYCQSADGNYDPLF
nr:immunoglobulin light chain junction region [Macaca mulatta]MOW31932.1 immunoglobulin light chain junction region [Macaca mulatta]